MAEIYRELCIIFAPEFIPRNDAEKVTHKEFLVTRGLPISLGLRQYTMEKTVMITVRLDDPITNEASAYLDYLKSIAIIKSWAVTETPIEE